jgi:hypothetical protein
MEWKGFWQSTHKWLQWHYAKNNVEEGHLNIAIHDQENEKKTRANKLVIYCT